MLIAYCTDFLTVISFIIHLYRYVIIIMYHTCQPEYILLFSTFHTVQVAFYNVTYLTHSA